MAEVNLAQREAIVRGDIRLRIERLEEEEVGIFSGELTRMQTTNYPSEVHPDGVRPLGVEAPLGHSIAFRYRVDPSVLIIQYEPRIASPGKFMEYLSLKFQDAKYSLLPKLRIDQMRRFLDGETRKVKIRLASPADLVDLEGPAAAVADSFRSLGAAYEAPELTIELSMGRRSGGLADSVKEMVQNIIVRSADIDLRSLRATTQNEDGENEDIDLIRELFKHNDILDLPDNNPVVAYERKRSYLRSLMQEGGF